MIPDLSGRVIDIARRNFALQLWTEGNWMINLEGSVVVVTESADGSSEEVVATDGEGDLPPELEQLVGARLRELVAVDGRLELHFDGWTVIAPACAHFEAWQLNGPGDELFVCTPGGEVCHFPPWPATLTDTDPVMARFSTVLFDFDGTLADTIGLILASFRHTLTTMGEPALPEDELRSWIGRPLRDAFEERWPGRGDEFVACYRQWNLAHHDELIVAVDGIVELVTELRERGVKLGVVSSKRREVVELGLRAVGLDGLIPVLVAMGESAAHKPAPDPLLDAAAQVGAAPAECGYVGDAVVDVQAAIAAGMGSIGVTWGAATGRELAAAGAHLVSTVTELRGALLNQYHYWD